MHPTEADRSPAERRREVATVLAAGILRLSTRAEAAPEPTSSAAEDVSSATLSSC